jgi:hypothetical protein
VVGDWHPPGQYPCILKAAAVPIAEFGKPIRRQIVGRD